MHLKCLWCQCICKNPHRPAWPNSSRLSFFCSFAALFVPFYYFNMNLSIVLFVILKPSSEQASDICLARFFLSVSCMHSFVFASFRCVVCLWYWCILCQYSSKTDNDNIDAWKFKNRSAFFPSAHPLLFSLFLYGFLAIVSHEHTCFTVHMPCFPLFWLRVSAVNVRCYHNMPYHMSYCLRVLS